MPVRSSGHKGHWCCKAAAFRFSPEESERLESASGDSCILEIIRYLLDLTDKLSPN